MRHRRWATGAVIAWTLLLVLAQAAYSEARLANGTFEDNTGEAPRSWDIKFKDIATLGVIKDVGHGGNILHALLKDDSSGDRTLIISQSLDASGLKGQTVSYGGEVRTSGKAAVYLRLWCPEGNSAIEVRGQPALKPFSMEFKVPANASFIAFAVEVVGGKGDEAWVDNLFVTDLAATPQKATPSAPPAPPASRPAANVIVIDPGKRLGAISPLKFGVHVEWINSGHGVWDVKNGAPDKRVLDLLKPLSIPIVRFPGGIYSDYYDWRDGVGPLKGRGYGTDPFDNSTVHRHDFGTDEFITLLRETGAEPLITANYGTGSLDMAVSWLRHFREKGVNARYWEIGNEIYMADPKDKDAANGARIWKGAARYAEDFVIWARALKSVDSSVMVGAVGGINNAHESNRDWMDTLLKKAGGSVDFLALHNSFAPIIPGSFDYSSKENRNRAYRAMLAQVEDVKSDIGAVKERIRRHAPQRAGSIRIAITEHFPIFGIDTEEAGRRQLLQNIDQTRTLAGALYTATILTAIVKDPQVFMANFLNPVHAYYGALINNSGNALVKNPVYHVFHMYRNYFGEELLKTDSAGAVFSTPALGMVPAIKDAPLIEAAAALDNEGRITIALVNKDMDSGQAVRIETGEAAPYDAELYTLGSSRPDAVTAEPISDSTWREEGMGVKMTRLVIRPGGTIELPAFSFSILRLRKAKG